MNAKTCKELRKIARAATTGRPERMLVQFVNPNKSISAVNAPGTTRYVYRNLKTGRTIDPTRIVRQKVEEKKVGHTTTMERTTTVERMSALNVLMQKVKTWFRRFIK